MRWQTYPYRGEMLSVPEIAKKAGLATSTVRKRMKEGMTPEEAAATPPWRGKQHLYRGEMLTVKEIAARAGIGKERIYERMKKFGISAEDAADEKYPAARYSYEGEMLTVKEIAARANIDPKVLGARLHRGYCTAEEAVRRARLLDGERQACARKRKLETAREIAEELIGLIVNDATVERNEDGSFSARTRLYELIASFPAVGMAVLTAKWRKTGAVSMIRKYAIKDGTLVQTEAVAV